MSFMELAQRGFNRESKNLANHFDEVWQETNRKARQDLNKMGAAPAPNNLNHVGKISYRGNGAFSAAATVPDFVIRATGTDKAAAHLYDTYAPDKAKQIAAEAGQAYIDWASNNPNIAETSKFGLNVATSVAGIKAGLPKKAGRGHDDFADIRWAQTGGSAHLTEAQSSIMADVAYEKIRASNADVLKIAQNTGIKPENIQKVKNYVFYDEHILDRFVDYGIPAEIRRFDSDIEQANAWKRLENGSYTSADIEWLKHETAERWYEKKHNSGYSEAHEAAQRKWNGAPWKE